jgi:cysteinyl-tRNA synthetase
MHCKHLLVDGRKMSKSENNFFTLRDLAARGWTGREVRYVLAAVKYREPLNFTFESLEAARKALARYDEWSERLKTMPVADPEPLPPELDLEKFGQALDDDLNISAALGVLFELIRDSNRLIDAGQLSPGQARSLLAWREKFESVLALAADEEGIPEEVRAVLARRAEARARKEWALSDALRDQLLATGWQVKDTKEGQKLSRRG